MKWLKRSFLILSVPASLITIVVLGFLYPGWAYANQTDYQHFRIYHEHELQEGWPAILDSVEKRLLASGIYDRSLTYKICLQDGSLYPDLIKSVAGESFAFAGVDVIILECQVDLTNQIAIHGELIYDLVTLLSHEAIHCLEYRHQGLWGANPMAGHPTWKWEGYAELMGREPEFIGNVNELKHFWIAAKEGGWVNLEDGTMVHSNYLRFALLSKLCLDANGGDFDRFLADHRPESYWIEEMELLF